MGSFARKSVLAVSAVIMAAGMCFFSSGAAKMLFATQPDWYFLTPHSYKKFDHIMGVSFGYRALLADFEYISFLQYYGDRSNMTGRWTKLYTYIDNMTDADPHFTFAYTYGGAILAFNLKKYDEAIAVIQKGLRYNPQFWKLRYYMAAIMYSKQGDTLKYISLLEDALKFNDHPAIIERLLGNIYEVSKTPDEAAKYWAWVYKNTKDKETKKYAYDRILFMLSEKKISNPQGLLQ